MQSENYDSIEGENDESGITNDVPLYLPAHMISRSVVSGLEDTAPNTTKSGSRMGGNSLLRHTLSFGTDSSSLPSLPSSLPSHVGSVGTNASSLTGTKTNSTTSAKLQNIKGEMIIVNAPAGRLGIFIDTTDNGLPFIHRISDKCPIAKQIRLNDMIIAVDGKDIRNLSAT